MVKFSSATIVIADDHPIVLAAIRDIVEEDSRLRLLATARNSAELVAAVSSHQPDIVITDYSMPGDDAIGDGMRLVSYLLRHFPATKVLVLTMMTNPIILSSLLKTGVHAVALKSGDLSEIRDALSALLDNRQYRPKQFRGSPGVAEAGSLSPREVEVLRLYLNGQSVGEIAKYLNRSHKTVSSQKTAAMRKLGVRTEQELIEYCVNGNVFG